MKFARIVYGIAAVYGLLLLLPLYFLLGRVGHDAPPVVTHPEFYYGFVGLALLWQAIFFLIAKDPTRHRPIMLIAMLEKFIYTVPVVILYELSRVQRKILAPSLERFRNDCGLIKIARSGFPWEKTTKRPFAFPDFLRAALTEGNDVRLSLRKAACSSMAPPSSTGNPGSVYTNCETALANPQEDLWKHVSTMPKQPPGY